jgi:hypothetical protein
MPLHSVPGSEVNFTGASARGLAVGDPLSLLLGGRLLSSSSPYG